MGEETDMRKRRVLFAAICCSAVAGVGAVASTAGATGPGSGAAVIRDDGGTCFTSDNTSSWLFSCRVQIVIEPGGAITQHITGSVSTADSSPLPSRAVRDITTADNGLPCLVLNNVVITTVVAGVVTPGGQVMLTCRS
jgi:hypothetical protein